MACRDATEKAAEAKHCKSLRSWAKHPIRKTNTSYRLTLELSRRCTAAVGLNELLGICG
jgi:hypothetical protein